MLLRTRERFYGLARVELVFRLIASSSQGTSGTHPACPSLLLCVDLVRTTCCVLLSAKAALLQGAQEGQGARAGASKGGAADQGCGAVAGATRRGGPQGVPTTNLLNIVASTLARALSETDYTLPHLRPLLSALMLCMGPVCSVHAHSVTAVSSQVQACGVSFETLSYFNHRAGSSAAARGAAGSQSSRSGCRYSAQACAPTMSGPCMGRGVSSRAGHL